MTTVAAISNRSIFVPEGDRLRKKSIRLANAMVIELMNYGIAVDDEIVYRIACHKRKDAVVFCNDILKMFTIGDVNPPLFRGWEDRTYFSLGEFIVQIRGYLCRISGEQLEDLEYMSTLRRTVEFKKVKQLSLADADVVNDRLTELLDSKVILDRATFDTLVSLSRNFPTDKPIRIKSDQARCAAILGIVAKGNTLRQALSMVYGKPSDVLRFLAASVDHDTWNLPADVKYATVPWSVRVSVMSFLASFDFDDLCEAMGNNRGAWTRFVRHFRVVQQRDFRTRFPDVVLAAFVSRGSALESLPPRVFKRLTRFVGVVDKTESGNLVYRTFASRLRSAVDSQDLESFKVLIRRRPSLLFRNLATYSHVATKTTEGDFVTFVRSLIGKVDVNVLMSIIQIDVKAKYRIIDSKGNTTVTDADYHPVIGEVQRLGERELFRRYGRHGQITVSKDLQNKVVPFLSTNSELDRGTRIPFENEKYLYFLMHWVQANRRTDLDHSYVCFDEDWNSDTVYFGNQANRYIKQSGDIVSAPAPEGGTEYGRIDLEKIPKGVRYIVPIINVYCGENFAECAEAYAGFSFSDSDVFSLKRKHVRYDLTQPAQANIPFVIDVQNRELIIVDFNNREAQGRTAHNYASDLRKIILALQTRNTLTIGRFAAMLSGESDEPALRIRKTATEANEIEPNQLHTLIGAGE